MRFEGCCMQFGLAGEERNGQNLPSTEPGCAVATTEPLLTTSSLKTTTAKDLVLTTTGIIY